MEAHIAMIDKVNGQNYQSSKAGQINPTGSETGFPRELDKVFKKVKSQLKEIPGMSGVYYSPTLASLNITDIFDKTV
jgi:hypothetical protein